MHNKGRTLPSYCYTTDAIAAMLYILLHGKDGEAYNVANETTYISIKDMATFLAETFNPRVKVVVELKENMAIRLQQSCVCLLTRCDSWAGRPNTTYRKCSTALSNR